MVLIHYLTFVVCNIVSEISNTYLNYLARANRLTKLEFKNEVVEIAPLFPNLWTVLNCKVLMSTV